MSLLNDLDTSFYFHMYTA